MQKKGEPTKKKQQNMWNWRRQKLKRRNNNNGDERSARFWCASTSSYFLCLLPLVSLIKFHNIKHYCNSMKWSVLFCCELRVCVCVCCCRMNRADIQYSQRHAIAQITIRCPSVLAYMYIILRHRNDFSHFISREKEARKCYSVMLMLDDDDEDDDNNITHCTLVVYGAMRQSHRTKKDKYERVWT